MEKETITRYKFEQFLESRTMDGNGSLELAREEDKAALARTNNGFLLAGVVAIFSGGGLIVASNLGLGLGDFIPGFIAGGVVAVGFGLASAYRKIFRSKRLNLPRLTIRRKKRKNSKSNMNYQPGVARRQLAISESNKVFMGVAAGLAKHADVSPSMMRFAFIMAFFFSGGFFAMIYFGMAFFLPKITGRK